MAIQNTTTDAISGSVRSLASRLSDPAFWNGRRFRIAAGISILAVIVSIEVGRSLFVVSTGAVVNARVVSVRASIDGTLAGQTPRVGDIVEAGTPLAVVRNPRADGNFLAGLKVEREALTRRVAALDAELAALDALSNELARKGEQFKAATLEALEQQRAERVAQRAGEASILSERSAALRRDEALLKTGISTRQRNETLAAEVAKARSAVSASDHAIQGLDLQIARAREGVYLQTGGNDSPYTEQRRDEIALRILSGRSERAQQAARVEELGRQIEIEAARMALAAAAPVAAPLSGIVWKVGAAGGADVRAGDDLVQVLDCSSAFIDTLLPEEKADGIRVGDEVSYRFDGRSEYMTGRVTGIRGGGAVMADETLAAIVEPTRERQARARISLAPEDLRAPDATNCHVGRHVEVRFTTHWMH